MWEEIWICTFWVDWSEVTSGIANRSRPVSVEAGVNVAKLCTGRVPGGVRGVAFLSSPMHIPMPRTQTKTQTRISASKPR
jgi:hypothetical protein